MREGRIFMLQINSPYYSGVFFYVVCPECRKVRQVIFDEKGRFEDIYPHDIHFCGFVQGHREVLCCWETNKTQEQVRQIESAVWNEFVKMRMRVKVR